MFGRAVFLMTLLAGAGWCASSWESLQNLRGQHVKVAEITGEEQKGVCDSITPEAITVNTGKGSVSIERAKVRRIQVSSGMRRLRNFAIGAAIGLAVGVVVDQTLGTYLRNETGDSGRAVTYAAPIGLFGGIGALQSGYRTVYHMP